MNYNIPKHMLDKDSKKRIDCYKHRISGECMRPYLIGEINDSRIESYVRDSRYFLEFTTKEIIDNSYESDHYFLLCDVHGDGSSFGLLNNIYKTDEEQ